MSKSALVVLHHGGNESKAFMSLARNGCRGEEEYLKAHICMC